MLIDPLFTTLHKLRLLESSNQVINEAWADLSVDEKQVLDNLIKNKITPRIEKEPELRIYVDRYNALKKNATDTVDKADPIKIKKFRDLINKATGSQMQVEPEPDTIIYDPKKKEKEKDQQDQDDSAEVVPDEPTPQVDQNKVTILFEALNAALQSKPIRRDKIFQVFEKLPNAETWYAVEKAYNEKYKPKLLRTIIFKRTEKADRIKLNNYLERINVSDDKLI